MEDGGDKDSDEEWGNWGTEGKKEGAEDEQPKEPAPFTRILQKGSKGGGGGRRRERRHGDRGKVGKGGKVGMGKMGKFGKKGFGKEDLNNIFIKRPGQVVLPKARPTAPGPAGVPPPAHLQGRAQDVPRIITPKMIPTRPMRGQPFPFHFGQPQQWRPPPPPAPGVPGGVPGVPGGKPGGVPVPPPGGVPVPPPGMPGMPMEWRPPAAPLHPAPGPRVPFTAFAVRAAVPPPPPAPRPKIRPSQKRPAPSGADEAADKRRPNEPAEPPGAPGAPKTVDSWKADLGEWLLGADGGYGVLLRYEEALLEYGSFDELFKVIEDPAREEDFVEYIDIEKAGHLLLLKQSLAKLKQSRCPEEPKALPRPQPKPAFIMPQPKPRPPNAMEATEMTTEAPETDIPVEEELAEEMPELGEGEESEEVGDEEWQDYGYGDYGEEEWMEDDGQTMEKLWQGVLDKEADSENQVHQEATDEFEEVMVEEEMENWENPENERERPSADNGAPQIRLRPAVPLGKRPQLHLPRPSAA